MFDVFSMSAKVRKKEGEEGENIKMFCKIMKVKMHKMYYILVRKIWV